MAAVDVGAGVVIENDWPTLRVVPRPFEGDATAWAVNPRAPNLLEALNRFLSLEQIARLAHAERSGDLPEILRRGVLRVITRNNAAIGLMQMLPRTAREFGVEDLRDPEQSIRAGVAYLAWLHSRFELELAVKDRIWFALAAYNAGFGHVSDARRLARELDHDPNRWFDNVELAMRLLSKRVYYRNAAFGYVRGYETVKYVREIRERYRTYLQTTSVR